MDQFFSFKICSPRIDLSNEVQFTSNGDHMPKLRPWEVETPIYPNVAHSFGASSPRVRVLNVQGFPLFLNNKQAPEPHCNSFQRHVAATSLLRDSYQCPSQFIYIMSVNEVLFPLHLCIYGYMFILLRSCINLDQWYQRGLLFLDPYLHVPNEVGV